MTELERIEDFTLFLFLHMGRVDGSLHPNERETIIEKMTELYPDRDPANDDLARMESAYASFKMGVAEELIQDGSRKFSSLDPARKKQIYEALFDIINANGKVNEEETQTLRSVRAWLAP